jgi:hypothetical protein
VRELKFGLVLHVMPLLSADHQTLERCVLQPVKALGYRIRGLVSDDERALLLAVAHVFPGVRHQTCQSHCLREAATPIVEADQTFKKALKQAIRAPFYAAGRALNQLAPEDPRQAVLTLRGLCRVDAQRLHFDRREQAALCARRSACL